MSRRVDGLTKKKITGITFTSFRRLTEVTNDEILGNLPAGRQVFFRSFVVGSDGIAHRILGGISAVKSKFKHQQ